MKKIIFITSIIAFAIFLLTSCNNSEIKTLTITKDQELVFSESEYSLGFYDVITIKKNEETFAINNFNLVERICFFRQAYPEKDIYIKYHENKKGEKEFRFVDINIKKNF